MRAVFLKPSPAILSPSPVILSEAKDIHSLKAGTAKDVLHAK
jgi:hypothetical protein